MLVLKTQPGTRTPARLHTATTEPVSDHDRLDVDYSAIDHEKRLLVASRSPVLSRVLESITIDEHREADYEHDRAVLASQNQAVNGSRQRHES